MLYVNIIEKIRKPQRKVIYIPTIIFFVVLNLLFSLFNNNILQSPLFLDSIFTATAAVLFGPVIGVITGLITNFGMELIFGMTGYYWPFAICNMATGLILGLMTNKGYFNTKSKLTISILSITFANVILGTLVAYFVFDGYSGVQLDHIVAALRDMGLSLFSAAFWARIPSNLIDKMISVYTAYTFYKYVFRIPEKNS